LSIFKQALGPDHPNVATTLNNIASCLNDLGRPAEAKKSFEQALAIRRRALGSGHSEVGTTLWWLARIARDNDHNNTEAAKLAKEAGTIFSTALGPTHPTTVAFREDFPSA